MIHISPVKQLNFMANRVLAYGDLACNSQEVLEQVTGVRDFKNWHIIWMKLGEKAEKEKRYLHAANYFRMAEFFMKKTDEGKIDIYTRCVNDFYRGFDEELHLDYERFSVPFGKGFLNTIRLSSNQRKASLLVCGGYDSFIEEFLLQTLPFLEQGYEVIMFEGPGQGLCLQQKMYFRYDFEKVTSAVIDYFHLESCYMLGISWGGYFALRSSAFDERIRGAIAYDVLDNGAEVMTNIFPVPLRQIFRYAIGRNNKRLINGLAGFLMKRNLLADWGLSQGMYITGSSSPYEMYQRVRQHDLSGITDRLKAHYLLLAGEADHYIPQNQYYRLKNAIHHAASLQCHMYTAEEGGEQHCQVGNHMLAVQEMLDWLNHLTA